MVCEYWETISLSCGVIDSGDTCGSHSTGNASGGGSGYGAGGAGGLGDNFDGQSGGTAGSAGRIVITWP
jgi:hypothetical protein